MKKINKNIYAWLITCTLATASLHAGQTDAQNGILNKIKGYAVSAYNYAKANKKTVAAAVAAVTAVIIGGAYLYSKDTNKVINTNNASSNNDHVATNEQNETSFKQGLQDLQNKIITNLTNSANVISNTEHSLIDTGIIYRGFINDTWIMQKFTDLTNSITTTEGNIYHDLYLVRQQEEISQTGKEAWQLLRKASDDLYDKGGIKDQICERICNIWDTIRNSDQITVEQAQQAETAAENETKIQRNVTTEVINQDPIKTNESSTDLTVTDENLQSATKNKIENDNNTVVNQDSQNLNTTDEPTTESNTDSKDTELKENV